MNTQADGEMMGRFPTLDLRQARIDAQGKRTTDELGLAIQILETCEHRGFTIERACEVTKVAWARARFFIGDIDLRPERWLDAAAREAIQLLHEPNVIDYTLFRFLLPAGVTNYRTVVARSVGGTVKRIMEYRGEVILSGD